MGRGLLWLAAVAAATAAASAVPTVLGADDATKVVESWRMYGLAVFAGLFVLLARRPRHYRGVWELTIAHKSALTVTGLVLLSDGVPGAGTVAVWDGALTVVLVAAYVCCRGWTAGPRLRPPTAADQHEVAGPRR